MQHSHQLFCPKHTTYLLIDSIDGEKNKTRFDLIVFWLLFLWCSTHDNWGGRKAIKIKGVNTWRLNSAQSVIYKLLLNIKACSTIYLQSSNWRRKKKPFFFWENNLFWNTISTSPHIISSHAHHWYFFNKHTQGSVSEYIMLCDCIPPSSCPNTPFSLHSAKL